ncbi:MAG TPA: prepilin-type N-terminal cleavage/methylation domain-containing protein [Usitatibacter sp.]|jgi:prepilin-type N-terminal cleavage/methylation domain-containing protein|nr:prepilin-type N-terminal cleavage/methylation domain-containing protein [Usitatibacter sp.]
MKSRQRQTGFTLVEIAIVLVIIGLLLGGILKGQELINSAKVKNLANDFRTIPTYIYGYQDKFRALPGDDCKAGSHVGAPAADQAVPPAPCPTPFGNGVINGLWNSTTQTDESYLFWQQVRLANLAAGPTALGDADYIPKNAVGGPIGITSPTTTPAQAVAGLTGTYMVCSGGILGKFAKQLDIQMDDGNTATGSMRVVDDLTATGGTAKATTAVDDATNYTVCMAF